MTGVGRGLDSVLPYLAKEFEVVLLTDSTRPAAPGDLPQVALSGWWGLPEPLWLHASAARWLRGFRGVFHGTYNGLPATHRGPSVVTVHDLSFDHHPEDYSRSRQAVIAATAHRSVRRANVVLTPSRFIRRALVASGRVDPGRVCVAPQGVAPVFHPERRLRTPAVVAGSGVEGPYVVAVGGAKRRALGVAVEAWSRLAAPRPPLVVVGSEQPPLRPGVFHLGRIDDESWASVLAGATAFVYPTRYEGYGMPAIEAAACGVPVVCAAVGPLPEVLGDAAEWSASGSPDDIRAALQRVVDDPALRSRLAAAGLARVAAAPGWAEIAAVIGSAYRRAWEEGGR